MTMKVMKVVFVSRHAMTCAQVADLEKYLGHKVEVVAENITFSASEDPVADLAANKAILGRLFNEYDVVTGVFPPVALEALMSARAEMASDPSLGNVEDTGILTPVSRQLASERSDGSKVILFEHVRFARI